MLTVQMSIRESLCAFMQATFERLLSGHVTFHGDRILTPAIFLLTQILVDSFLLRKPLRGMWQSDTESCFEARR